MLPETQLGAQIMVTMLLLVRVMSWAPALAGVGVTVILVPGGSFISRRLAKVRRQIVANTDARMKLTTEVIPACCSLKMFGKNQRCFPASPCSAETVACLACQ